MVDYGVFDSLFDSVIVIDQDRKILYCNETAASLAGSSVRRLTKGVVFSDVYLLSEVELFPMSGGAIGRDEAAPMQELNFTIKNSEKAGKLQVTIQPFAEGADKRWTIVMHDVTLEETLHVKYQGELEQKEGYIRDLQVAKAQLEDYSANLEKKVEERTAEVRQANRMLNAIMNSLGQGFLVFDANGMCSDIFTRACEEILEGIPAKRPIWDVLKLDEANTAQFKMWMQAVLGESLPFESLAELAPSLFTHSQHERHIPLNFYPIRNDEGAITNIVMVATDRTREHQAEEALLKEQQYIQMVLKVIKSRDQFGLFLESAKALIEKTNSDLAQPMDKFDVSDALRTLHTLEGEAGLFSAAAIRQKARDCQEVLEPVKRGDVHDLGEVLGNLKKEVADLELVYVEFLKAHRELLEVLRVGKSRNIEVSLSKLLGFAKMLDENPSLPRLRERFSEDLLKQPLTLYIQHFNEIAQHVAQIQGKQIEPVEFDTSDVKIAPGSIDPLIASMVHVFRNAVDHGIEDPNLRSERGKPANGKITVQAKNFSENNKPWIRLVITDDGGGIDPQRIREKLAQKFPQSVVPTHSDEEVIQAIFLPGFSSRDSVGQFSGRGIGMDAIKTEVLNIGGRVWISSKVGQGTKLTIEFPEVIPNADLAKSA